jgi:hypothetical protein
VSVDHGQAWLCLSHSARVCRGAESLECAPKFQIRNPKRVQGFVPAEGLGVPPNSTNPPRVGDRGLKAIMVEAPLGTEKTSAGGHNPCLRALDSCVRANNSKRVRGTCPCRGSGGVPQYPFLIPQEWGTGG